MPKAPTGTVAFRKGAWHARISARDANGRVVRPWVSLMINEPNTEEGREAARRKAVEVSQLARQGAFVQAVDPDDGPAPVTMGDVVDKWLRLLETHPGNRKGTSNRNYTSRIKTAFLPAFRDAVPPLTVAQLRAFFRQQTGSASSIHCLAAAVGHLLHDALAEGWIEGENAMRDPRVREVLPRIVAPEPEEIAVLPFEHARVLLACELVPRDRRDLYLCAMATGMRPGEIFGLQRGDLDFEEQSISVRRQLNDLGKLTTPKSRWSRRTLPMHAALLRRLRRFEDAGPAVFLFSDGETRTVYPYHLRADLETAGLPSEGIDLRALRHSFATWLADRGAPGDVVDQLLGHAPASTRLRHYVKRNLDTMAQAVALLPFDLDDAPGTESGTGDGNGSFPSQLSRQLSREKVHESESLQFKGKANASRELHHDEERHDRPHRDG
jgi:integrase